MGSSWSILAALNHSLGAIPSWASLASGAARGAAVVSRWRQRGAIVAVWLTAVLTLGLTECAVQDRAGFFFRVAYASLQADRSGNSVGRDPGWILGIVLLQSSTSRLGLCQCLGKRRRRRNLRGPVCSLVEECQRSILF